MGSSPVLAHDFHGHVGQPGDDGQIDDGDNSVLHGCHLLLNVIARISYKPLNRWAGSWLVRAVPDHRGRAKASASYAGPVPFKSPCQGLAPRRMKMARHCPAARRSSRSPREEVFQSKKSGQGIRQPGEFTREARHPDDRGAAPAQSPRLRSVQLCLGHCHGEGRAVSPAVASQSQTVNSVRKEGRSRSW